MKRILSILFITVLVFLIVGIIDIFLFASWAFGRSVQKGVTFSGFSVPIANVPKPTPSPPHYESLVKNTLVAHHNINYKRLFIDIDPRQVLVDYDVYLRKDHPLFINVEIDERDGRAEKVANELLGAVSVSNELLKFENVRTSIAETDESAHIEVFAAAHPAPTDSYKIKVHAKQLSLALGMASNEVIVLTRGVSVRTNKPYLPVSKTQDHTIYSLPADAGELDFFVDVIDPAGRSEPTTRETLAALLQKEYSIPGFGDLMYGLLDAIPFILFIVWSSRNASAIPDVHSQQDVVKAYLVLHFSFYFFQSLSILIERWHSPFAWALNHFERQTLPVFNATGYNNTTYLLLVPMLAMFLYVWPKFARVYTEPKKERTSSWREKGKKISTVLIAVLIFVVLLALLTRLLPNKLGTIRTCLGCLTVTEFYLLFFGVLVLVLYVLIVLLGQFVGRPAGLQFSLTLFSIVMLLIVADFFYIYAEYSGNKYVFFANGVFSVLVFAVSATAVVWAFAVLAYRAITGQSLHNSWKEWNAQKRLLLITALLAVALSTLSWTWPMKYWPLWWLTWELKDLFFLVLVWFLTTFLRRTSAEHEWLMLPDSAHQAGILLALILFYSATTRWNYIPVPLIVGYLLLKFWLLPKKQFDRDLFSQIKIGLNRFIERVIAFNDAERALKTLKKELLSKLGKGELEPQQYSDKLSAQSEALKACRQDLIVRDQFAKDYVLALGPGNSAWKNGYTTAGYSLLFSIPWTFFYFRDIVRAEVTSESYVALGIIKNLIIFLLVWVSYGFIFGYFYPYIRGRNGIQKGLVMFLTIVIPHLVWTALVRPIDVTNWNSFGFWILQIFVHSMLLGMITGDLFIMRYQGYRWSHLLDFYRLTSLSAWVSSVILAIAAAVSTLIASGAAEILTSAFKYAGVIPPDVRLPKE